MNRARRRSARLQRSRQGCGRQLSAPVGHSWAIGHHCARDAAGLGAEVRHSDLGELRVRGERERDVRMQARCRTVRALRFHEELHGARQRRPSVPGASNRRGRKRRRNPLASRVEDHGARGQDRSVGPARTECGEARDEAASPRLAAGRSRGVLQRAAAPRQPEDL